MKTDYIIIYLSQTGEDIENRVNLIIKTAKALSKYTKVIYYRPDQGSFISRNLFRFIFDVINLFKAIVLFSIDRFIVLNNYETEYPKNYVLQLLQKIELKIIKYIFKLKKVIIITSYGSNHVLEFIEFVDPVMVFADRVDLWNKKEFEIIGRKIKVFFSNADVIYYGQPRKKYLKVLQYGEGLVSKNVLSYFHKISIRSTLHRRKTILYIGSITWRMNLPLIYYCARSLSDFNFLIVGTNWLDRKFNTEWDSKNTRYVSVWDKITKLQNVKVLYIENQEDLLKLSISANVGMIPYNIKEPFSKYCHPIKLYHYFALGIPVVSMPIKAIKNYASNYCRFVSKRKDFVKCLKRLSMISLSKKTREEMYYISLQHTYEKKANFIIKVINREVCKDGV